MHDVQLLLRSDVHRLFDADYVMVTPQYEVEVCHHVRDDFNDGEKARHNAERSKG